MVGESTSSGGNGVVVLVFYKCALPQQERQKLMQSDLAQSLEKHFAIQKPDQSHSTRWLDHIEGADTARVLEIRYATGSNPTLAECTAATQSPELSEMQLRDECDLVIQPLDIYLTHRQPGLAVFDMDSTLIQQEVIDELARAVGLYEQVAAITEAAMRGEAPYTDFETSLRARVALLKNVPMTIWQQLREGTITFTPGAKELTRCLRGLGWKTAVLSGGFTPLALWVKETLGLDYAFANHLVSDEQTKLLTGELVAEMPIIHAQKKRELLLKLAAENSIPVERTIAVGDGSNDLLMMGAAGMGVAFNAKPKVQLAAPARLNSPSLFDVVHVLGYTKQEVEQYLQ